MGIQRNYLGKSFLKRILGKVTFCYYFEIECREISSPLSTTKEFLGLWNLGEKMTVVKIYTIFFDFVASVKTLIQLVIFVFTLWFLPLNFRLFTIFYLKYSRMAQWFKLFYFNILSKKKVIGTLIFSWVGENHLLKTYESQNVEI